MPCRFALVDSHGTTLLPASVNSKRIKTSSISLNWQTKKFFSYTKSKPWLSHLLTEVPMQPSSWCNKRWTSCPVKKSTKTLNIGTLVEIGKNAKTASTRTNHKVILSVNVSRIWETNHKNVEKRNLFFQGSLTSVSDGMTIYMRTKRSKCSVWRSNSLKSFNLFV